MAITFTCCLAIRLEFQYFVNSVALIVFNKIGLNFLVNIHETRHSLDGVILLCVSGHSINIVPLFNTNISLLNLKKSKMLSDTVHWAKLERVYQLSIASSL